MTNELAVLINSVGLLPIWGIVWLATNTYKKMAASSK